MSGGGLVVVLLIVAAVVFGTLFGLALNALLDARQKAWRRAPWRPVRRRSRPRRWGLGEIDDGFIDYLIWNEGGWR